MTLVPSKISSGITKLVLPELLSYMGHHSEEVDTPAAN